MTENHNKCLMLLHFCTCFLCSKDFQWLRSFLGGVSRKAELFLEIHKSSEMYACLLLQLPLRITRSSNTAIHSVVAAEAPSLSDTRRSPGSSAVITGCSLGSVIFRSPPAKPRISSAPPPGVTYLPSKHFLIPGALVSWCPGHPLVFAESICRR
ncbi:hypothetical protein ILYODFUR_009778 [Ilyodon furcidens]|uniref:Uncharacterized protein n=1 Tax=Ilyodon furcidens TaxID=33524 RepID=A0ABV0V2J8_9TELE